MPMYFSLAAIVSLCVHKPETAPGHHTAKRSAQREHYRKHGADERVEADQLFSLRARRRLAAYLRMRLLEMREAGLERAADAVERRLPVDELIAPER